MTGCTWASESSYNLEDPDPADPIQPCTGASVLWFPAARASVLLWVTFSQHANENRWHKNLNKSQQVKGYWTLECFGYWCLTVKHGCAAPSLDWLQLQNIGPRHQEKGQVSGKDRIQVISGSPASAHNKSYCCWKSYSIIKNMHKSKYSSSIIEFTYWCKPFIDVIQLNFHYLIYPFVFWVVSVAGTTFPCLWCCCPVASEQLQPLPSQEIWQGRNDQLMDEK